MANKKKKPKAEPIPLFSKFPAEIQLMIFHEALRKPQIHFVEATRDQNGQTPAERGRSIPTWSLFLTPKNKNGDTSGYRMFNDIQDVALHFPVAAEVIRKNILEPRHLPLFKDGSWIIDAATDLVVLEFGPEKSGKMRFWHPKNRVYNTTQDIATVRQQLEGIRKVAFVYGANQQPDAGSSESVFQCLQHHQRKHSNWKFCPEELLGLIYQLSHIETVYFILQHRVNAKAVLDYANCYFSVPAATRNSLGFKTFYSTTRSYITVPLPSYKIGPVYRASWKSKDSIWPDDPPISLIKEARETVLTLPPDSGERQYVEHARKLSRLALKLDHRNEVTPLISQMMRQMRMDQDTPLSPDFDPELEWPEEFLPDVNTAHFKALQQEHRRRYNLDKFTKERRDNLEFGMLLMANDTVVRKDEEKDKGVKSNAGDGNKKKEGGKVVA